MKVEVKPRKQPVLEEVIITLDEDEARKLRAVLGKVKGIYEKEEGRGLGWLYDELNNALVEAGLPRGFVDWEYVEWRKGIRWE